MSPGFLPGSVTLASLHLNEVANSWHESVLRLLGHDMGSQGRVMQGGWISRACYGADGIPAARNKVVEQFLDGPGEWLLWIDSDMGFAPDALDRLLEVADPVDRPVVGGLCFAHKHTDPDGMGGWRSAVAPTIYDWTEMPDGKTGFLSRFTYPVNQVIQCGGTGGAFVLIHRRVLEKIGAEDGPRWYSRIPNPTTQTLMGEDLSFCMRVGIAGFPIHVHTGVKTTHFKEVWLGDEDFWRQVVAPPAKEQTAVIVPVLHRPQHAEPFMRSLRASTGLATAYAVCTCNDDEDAAAIDAWAAAGATIIPAPPECVSFASKVNLAYEQTSEPWLFAVGSDVRFHPGWLDQAQATAVGGFDVIGTNDLGPYVMDGEASPHLLIRRSYVDEHGASWDGPKVLAHEGYRHGGVDLEICYVARERGVWAVAPSSIVEHLHPMWGRGERDEVYDLGDQFHEAGRELFASRFREHSSAAKLDDVHA